MILARPTAAWWARIIGRAMVEAAFTDLRALEMVLHANLAEQFLRDGCWRPPRPVTRILNVVSWKHEDHC